MTGQVGIIGAGPIGAGWAARFALMGWTVRVFDPAQDCKPSVLATLERARASLPALYDMPLPPEGPVSHHADLADVIRNADWIQLGPSEESSEIDHILQKVLEHRSPDMIVASSTAVPSSSGLASGQILVAQPRDPVYLIPLVELTVSSQTPALHLARAEKTLRALGMAPVVTATERPGQVADRLQAALVQEAQQLVAEGGATSRQIEDAIRLGLGLRWMQAGLEDDGAHAPDTDASTRAPAGVDVDPEGHRNDVLLSLLRVLKDRGDGAGAVLRDHEATLGLTVPDPGCSDMPVTLDRQVPITWVDYNGHMNEARFLQAFSNACDQLLEWAGMTPEAIAAGHSVFTVETHLRHLDEVQIGDRIRVTARVLEGGGKKFHIWQELRVGENLCSTCEQLLLHVDLKTRRSAPPPEAIATWLRRAMEAQAEMPVPQGLGRAVAQRS
ncbi:3-hydroxyacyl-CoA dehydrogenase [Roseibacterium elongatum DSM 19469]|uniref:3-hydroxyacyl-CoA dehydrogenase n=1 Tax=Roseicyclus elongatus DSM 19469 TaxID=1294273 RepID=W8SJ48_9RHOB|nr:thioesterase family protein [Roseibacterium elongatum]AHM02515.1 3-hydroxyacyl-CoA dehydrogenase [Roseibacterium elongatum DSM 19469]